MSLNIVSRLLILALILLGSAEPGWEDVRSQTLRARLLSQPKKRNLLDLGSVYINDDEHMKNRRTP